MEFFYWNLEKNALLKKERGICFEDMVLRVNTGHVLAVVDHPKKEKYPNQMIMIVNVDGYAYMVPFVPHEKGFLLKTIIPSRKYTKKYIKGDKL